LYNAYRVDSKIPVRSTMGISKNCGLSVVFPAIPDLARAECWYWIEGAGRASLPATTPVAVDAFSKAQKLLWASPSEFRSRRISLLRWLCCAASCDYASPDRRQQHFEALGSPNGVGEQYRAGGPCKTAHARSFLETSVAAYNAKGRRSSWRRSGNAVVWMIVDRPRSRLDTCDGTRAGISAPGYSSGWAARRLEMLLPSGSGARNRTTAQQAQRRSDILRLRNSTAKCHSSFCAFEKRIDGLRVVAGKEASLPLSDSNTSTRRAPDPDCWKNDAQSAVLSKMPIVERTGILSHPRSVCTSASCVAVMSMTRPNPICWCERGPCSGLALHIDERIARHEEVRGHYVTGGNAASW